MNRSKITALYNSTKKRMALEAKTAKVDAERSRFMSENLKQRIIVVFDHEVALEARELLRDVKSKFSTLVIKLASEIFCLRVWEGSNYKVIPILEIPSLKNLEEGRPYYISLLIPTKGPLDNILILDETIVQSGYIASFGGKKAWREEVIASEVLLGEAKKIRKDYDLIRELFWTNRHNL